MLNAYNNDIEYKSRWYHIQTEDNGVRNGHITTTVFHSGQTLDSKSTSYHDAIQGVTDSEEINRIVKERMVEQHQHFYKKLFDGFYDEKVAAMYSKTTSSAVNPAASSAGVAVGRVAAPVIGAAKGGDQTNSASVSGARPVIAGAAGSHASGPLPRQNLSASVGPTAAKQVLASSAVSQAPRANPAQHVAKLSKPLERSKAVQKDLAKSTKKAYSGVKWPKDDLAIDMLVVAIISGQAL